MKQWNYNKINNLCGWFIATVAFTVYFATMERTASFWDCGEFLAAAYKLEVGHSPGAPMFMMLQRLSSLFSGTAAFTGLPNKNAAFAINTFSVLASAITILFLFWTTTLLSRKLLAGKNVPDNRQTLLIMSAGIIGALAYTFSDTFWFSAVEAEVYATSSCFTALVFWAALKWEQVADEAYSNRWLLLISLLIGASVGIHLLNLLTIPAITMVYYFRKYDASKRGIIIAFVTGCLLLGIVQFGVIQFIPIIASNMELYFVNSFHLPFQSGALTFIILFASSIFFALRHFKRKQWPALYTATLCLVFIVIGGSSYIVTVIRSNADTPVDINNPDNVMSLVSYLQREQYLQQPLLYGQDFDSEITGINTGKNFYYKNEKEHSYSVAGHKSNYEYAPGSKRFFPRIWDNSDPSHTNFYRSYLDIDKDSKPTARDNFSYFFNYQMNWLWFRYFMWNYAGRQNDYEGQGEARNGNWISGIPLLDYPRAGHVNLMSKPYKNNDARNELYCLPLLLGFAGLCFHFKHNKKDAIIVSVLFFFTGIAIGIYLNMNPLQPRERDYAFAGCTYAFAIWIGIGLLMIESFIRKWLPKISLIMAFALCFISVPALMAKEEWNDHNRAPKTLARATALNTLLSCKPNAILFTQGDNDTFPLWYLQEVEGIRPDVRIIIRELLSADWYIDQLNYKINDAYAVPMVWGKGDYMGEASNYITYYNNPKIPAERTFDLYDVCKFMFKPENKMQANNGNFISYLPTKNLSMPLPPSVLKDTALMDKIYFKIKDDGLMKNDITIMNILAANAHNGWKRPIYFNGSYPNREDILGLSPYMRMEGIVYQLAPFTKEDYNAATNEVNNIDAAKSLEHFTRLYQYGGAEKQHVYFDEKNRVMLMAYRINSVQLAERLSASNRKKDAENLLDIILQNITPESYPHDQISMMMVMAYYHADAFEKGNKLSQTLEANLKQDIIWINDLPESQSGGASDDLKRDEAMLQQLAFIKEEAGKQRTLPDDANISIQSKGE
ncbi:glycosyltransferase family 117 protein [Taibaiella lutea]|nr:DUF2723 domain-containing protein [Taibaiella lutea]